MIAFELPFHRFESISPGSTQIIEALRRVEELKLALCLRVAAARSLPAYGGRCMVSA
jgi:hypothetical protein